MEMQIAIAGSPEEQARILKMIQHWSLVDRYNEITATQADAFDVYIKQQDMLITTLEAICQENNAAIDKIGQESITHAEKRRDAEMENDMLSKSNAAKCIVIKTLRAILKERNDELDDLDREATILADKLHDANMELAATNKRLEMKMDEIADGILSNIDDECRKLVERVKTSEEAVRELESHQQTLSKKIFQLKQEIKALKDENQYRKTRMHLLERRLGGMTEEVILKINGGDSQVELMAEDTGVHQGEETERGCRRGRPPGD